MTSESNEWDSQKEDYTPFPANEHPSMLALTTGKKISDVIMGIYHPKRKSRIWINICAVPEFKEGETKPFRVFTTFSDITKQKKAQSDIITNRSNLEALIENTSDMIWSIDKNYRLLTGNRKFLDYIEPIYKEILPIGSLLLDKQRLPLGLYEEWKQIYDKALAGKKFSMEYEYTNPSNDSIFL